MGQRMLRSGRAVRTERIDHRNVASRRASTIPHPTDIAVGERDIHAYVDGWLNTRRRNAVKVHLAGHTEHDAMVKAYIAQIDALKTTFGVVGPLPTAIEKLKQQWLVRRPVTKRPQKRGFPPRDDCRD